MKIEIRTETLEGSRHLHRIMVHCSEAKLVFASGHIYQSELIHGAEQAAIEAQRLKLMLEALGHHLELREASKEPAQ